MKNSIYIENAYSSKIYDELLLEAKELVDNDEFLKGIEIYSLLRDMNGTDTYVLYELANSYYYIGLYQKAIDIYLNIIKQDKEHVFLSYLLLGKSYRINCQEQEAIDTLEMVLTLYKNSDMSPFLYELAMCYFEIGEFKVSKSVFDNLLYISTDYSNVCHNYLYLIAIEDEDYNNAIKFLKKIDKSDFSYYFDLADLYAKDEDYNNAIIFYKKALELNPNHQLCLYSLGCSYQLTHDYENAIDCDIKLRELIVEEHTVKDIEFRDKLQNVIYKEDINKKPEVKIKYEKEGFWGKLINVFF